MNTSVAAVPTFLLNVTAVPGAGDSAPIVIFDPIVT
jgi:hypothetical protein